ncbi:hypothetical protein JNM05_04560 [bacterium]|nr:hypothetical protein [bacterium]
MNDQELLKKLTESFPDFVRQDYPWPEPFCEKPDNVRAIVLGTDPSYKLKRGIEFNKLQYVFELDRYKEGPSNPYFDSILENLKLIGLDLSSVFVENICRNYFTKVTYENDIWKEAAEIWIPRLKDELDRRFSDKNIPVLMTTEIIYHVLVKEAVGIRTARDLYKIESAVPILPEQNKLGRNLIPLYRHYEHKLKRHTEFKDRVKKLLQAGMQGLENI